MSELQVARLEADTVHLLDQRRLPLELAWLVCADYRAVGEAIKVLAVRGAPAIGIAAAYGMVLAAEAAPGDPAGFIAALAEAAAHLEATRPTAVNLSWAARRMLAVARAAVATGVPAARAVLRQEALAIAAEDRQMNLDLGRYGQAVVPQGARILTHCNAGALATGGWGTALGVVRSAHQAGKAVEVYATETRPLLQGARLTVWELMQDAIPVTLVTDGMAAQLMAQGKVDMVLVGADRIAANGDTANKIGTYGLAVLARAHGLPFYTVAPVSTIDLSVASGAGIVIEERDPEEVTHLGGRRIAPEGARAYNPSFDVTPHRYLTGIITNAGVVYAPYQVNLRRIVEGR